MRARIYTDGASRGNPGRSAIAFIIISNTGLCVRSHYIGLHTNNEAEYIALIEALTYAKQIGLDNFDVFTDSQLLANQVSGKFKVKSEKLRLLHTRVKELKKELDFKITHIKRENQIIKSVDRICNIVLDVLDSELEKGLF